MKHFEQLKSIIELNQEFRGTHLMMGQNQFQMSCDRFFL